VQVTAAGLDGCRSGWVAAIACAPSPNRAVDPPSTRLQRFDKLAEVVAWAEARGRPIVAVDVPMGLPGRAGPRACDRAARRELGRRWMSVFAPPDRELLGLHFVAAREVVRARRRAEPDAVHRVMTHQTMNIAPKVAEADRVLRADPGRQAWLIEAHPELSFQELAGVRLAGKRDAAGARRRRELIGRTFPDSSRRLAEAVWPPRAVAAADLLDAYAALWTALRFRRGQGSYRELGDGTRDAHGLLQRIIV